MMVDGSTRRLHRVVHVGTGLTGTQALRAVIDDPALELVGLKVSTADKAGVDAGRLSGGADVGIPATDDPDEIMALEPDCVLYCATAVRREAEAIAHSKKQQESVAMEKTKSAFMAQECLCVVEVRNRRRRRRGEGGDGVVVCHVHLCASACLC